MDLKKKKPFFPFNAEQTINILSEFGPLVTMFVVNAMYGINAGTWALVITTLLAIAVMYLMFQRPPFFPLIASTVTGYCTAPPTVIGTAAIRVTLPSNVASGQALTVNVAG